ncbi:hypothetical protein AS189_15720 [Arthrobacter alpinus]|uniref:Uncharacterized protein n=1 Tax=Arthrobacter alpinus TaxID=656366 RepID=A0A0S2M1R8_9MICC|nr:hypothetical protein AS189_15720 [Arthrobacter alpinus]
MLASFMKLNKVAFLGWRKFWWLPAQAAFGLSDLHSFARSRPDEISFKFRNHRQNIEKQFPYGIQRIVDRSSNIQLDLPTGKLVSDLMGIPYGASQSIQLGYNERVPGTASSQRLTQTWTVPI